MRGCLTLMVGIVLGVLLLAALQVFVISPSPPPRPAPATSDLVILFRNAFLTRQLQTQLTPANSLLSPKGMLVQAEPDQTLVLSGTAAVNGGSSGIPTRVILRLAVAKNRVTIEIVQAQVGSLKLPGKLFKSYESQINDNLNRTLTNSTYRVVGVSTTGEGLLVDVVLTR